MEKGLHRTFFGLVHDRRLIYHTCGEDPRIDRNLLALSPDSSVVVMAASRRR